MPTEGGRLILVGAPLGNVGDASPRLRDTLSTADVVAAEDTRRLARLARDLGIEVAGRVVSYFEGNEERRTPELAQALRDGLIVAVVTDGGMPSVSDPGFRLVRAAVDAGVPVTVAPGPSAVTTALAVSGLASDRFCFEGFLPRKPSERRPRLAKLAGEERTMVFFEAPHRLAASLADFVGGVRRRSIGGRMSGADQDVRRGAPRCPGRVGRLGGDRRTPRRDHDRGGGRRSRSPNGRPTRRSWRPWPTGRRPVPPARMRSPRSPRRTRSAAASSTTSWSARRA